VAAAEEDGNPECTVIKVLLLAQSSKGTG